MTLSAGLDLDDLEILRSGERLRDERLRMLTVGPRLDWRHGRRDAVLCAGSSSSKGSTGWAAVSLRSTSRMIRGARTSR